MSAAALVFMRMILGRVSSSEKKDESEYLINGLIWVYVTLSQTQTFRVRKGSQVKNDLSRNLSLGCLLPRPGSGIVRFHLQKKIVRVVQCNVVRRRRIVFYFLPGFTFQFSEK